MPTSTEKVQLSHVLLTKQKSRAHNLGISAFASSLVSGQRLASVANSNLCNFFWTSKLQSINKTASYSLVLFMRRKWTNNSAYNWSKTQTLVTVTAVVPQQSESRHGWQVTRSWKTDESYTSSIKHMAYIEESRQNVKVDVMLCISVLIYKAQCVSKWINSAPLCNLYSELASYCENTGT